MGDEAAGPVEHERVARLADMDRRDHVPDQLEVDHRDRDAIGLARARRRPPSCAARSPRTRSPGHTRCGPSGRRSPPGRRRDRCRCSTISGSTRETCSRSIARAVDQRHLDDRRHLAHQPQYVEAVPLVGALAPRQLHGPLQLVGDVVEKALDFAGRRYAPRRAAAGSASRAGRDSQTTPRSLHWPAAAPRPQRTAR